MFAFYNVYIRAFHRQKNSQKGNAIMARSGENIYKRKDGRWEGRYIKSYNAAGKAKYKYLYAKSYAEIKIKLSTAIVESNRERLEPTVFCLFSEISEKWLRRVKLNCKTSTFNKYYNTYESVLKPTFGNYQISKISGEMIDSFISDMLTCGRRDGKPYSRKTVHEICMEIKQIFGYAEECYCIKAQFSKKKLSVKQEYRDIQVINSFSLKILCEYLLTDTDLYKLGVLISLYTGIRVGELCALQWKDISFDDELLYVSKTAQRIQQFDNPYEKTKLAVSSPKSSCSNRIIPLPRTLIKILKAFKNHDNVYIVSGRCKCSDPRTMQYHFKKHLKACGIESVSFHTLRHTFATRCIEIGFDAKTLSEVLGHSSVNITLNRYVHSSLKRKQESMNKLIVGR